MTVPLQTPLFAAQEYAVRQERKERSILDQAVEHGKTLGVDVRPLLRAAHHLPTGILSIAESRDTGLILVGWWEPPSRSDVETHVAGAVIRGAKCNVAVLRDRGLDEVRSILIPAAEGTHARLGLLLAYAIAASTGAELTVLRVTGPEKACPEPGRRDVEGEERALERLVTGVLGVTEGRVATRVVKDKSVIGGILAETKRTDYDLLVIGAPGEWTLRDALFGSLPDRIASQAPCSVLMVRRCDPEISWLRRTLRRLRKRELEGEIQCLLLHRKTRHRPRSLLVRGSFALAAIGVASGVISLYQYFNVVRLMFFLPPNDETPIYDPLFRAWPCS